jgi:membrane protein involved in colicin uptake
VGDPENFRKVGGDQIRKARQAREAAEQRQKFEAQLKRDREHEAKRRAKKARAENSDPCAVIALVLTGLGPLVGSGWL